MRANGVEWIAQNPFGWMESQNSPHLQLSPDGFLWGETDAGIRLTTQKAHEHGMKVMLKPHVWLRRPTTEGWIGEIDFLSEADWQSWEADYRTFILHYAELAAQENIELFCVATELSNPVRSRPLFWKALVADIRKVYSGKLTYAANWYRDYDEITLWQDLDFIGVNAYFPLSDKVNPTLEEIQEGWKPIVDKIKTLAESFQKPVLFTEIGYKNVKGTFIRPWEWPQRDDNSEISNEEQALGYQALFLTFGKVPWFRGMFIWKWYPNSGRVTPDRVEFSPQNKSAEQVLKRWYTYTDE